MQFLLLYFCHQERDNALMSKRDVEREVELLKERLEANQRAMDATRAELELRDNRLSTLDREVISFCPVFTKEKEEDSLNVKLDFGRI